MDGKRILEILYNLYKITDCSFNDDYDCDGVPNTQDSCPNAYNPSLADLDRDGIANVCDDDIDGDGIKNPVGIVDDLDHIVLSRRDPNQDNCLFVVNSDQADKDKNGLGDACDNATNKNLSMYIAIGEMK